MKSPEELKEKYMNYDIKAELSKVAHLDTSVKENQILITNKVAESILAMIWQNDVPLAGALFATEMVVAKLCLTANLPIAESVGSILVYHNDMAKALSLLFQGLEPKTGVVSGYSIEDSEKEILSADLPTSKQRKVKDYLN